jgi:hypothetical protein
MELERERVRGQVNYFRLLHPLLHRPCLDWFVAQRVQGQVLVLELVP